MSELHEQLMKYAKVVQAEGQYMFLPELLETAAIVMTRHAELLSASKAVLWRWDSKDWNAAPTADYMASLRAAVDKSEKSVSL